MTKQVREEYLDATIADVAPMGGINLKALLMRNNGQCTQYNALGWCTVGCKYKHKVIKSGAGRVIKVLLKLKLCYKAMKSNKKAKMSV